MAEVEHALDISHANEKMARSYYMQGFALRIQRERLMPFIQWVMKMEGPGHEAHEVYHYENGYAYFKKINK